MSQQDVNIEEYVDQRRWLLNNGLVTDDVKNQLFFCGSIVHRDVQAVELQIDPETKIVKYTVYVDRDLLKLISKYETLSKSDSLFGMWRFKRMLKKQGSLDFNNILNNLVKDFCGPKWTATVNVIDFDFYVEGLGDSSGPEDTGKQLDKLLNQ